MNDKNPKQRDSTNRQSRRKLIFLAAFLFLFILTGYMYKVITWEPKPDPVSERIIREAAAKQLTTDPNNPIEPNELTDKDFAKITTLLIEREELSNIKLLEIFENLEVLILISIKSPEKEIPKWMTVLAKAGIFNLNERSEIDLSPLKKLSNLQILFLSNSQVSNLEPIKYLTNLKSLYLPNTQVSNLEPLKGLTNLHYLNLKNTKVSDFSQLKKLKSIQTIDLGQLRISDLEQLKELKNLRTLYINSCHNITDEQVEELQKALPELRIIR